MANKWLSNSNENRSYNISTMQCIRRLVFIVCKYASVSGRICYARTGYDGMYGITNT